MAKIKIIGISEWEEHEWPVLFWDRYVHYKLPCGAVGSVLQRTGPVEPLITHPCDQCWEWETCKDFISRDELIDELDELTDGR